METKERQRLIELLRKAIYELTGNYYPDERMKILEYKLEKLIRDMPIGSNSAEGVISYFLKSPERKRMLIDLMTVPETRFFREKEQLEVLFDSVLKGIQNLDIASIGCSTGQEPYTLAMMMRLRGIVGRIVGMDINEEVLQKAREGIYKSSELKDIPQEYREFVEVKGDLMLIKPEIKRMVEFRQANLIEGSDFQPFRGRFSVVLCRNVLIYFDKDSKRRALTNIRYIMREKGILVLSATELLGKEYQDLFEPFRSGRFLFFRKNKEGEG